MDESKKVEEFILDAGWPCWQGGEEIKLEAENWMRIIDEIIRRFKRKDILKTLSGFTPIRSLINQENENKEFCLMTDIRIVKLSEDLSMDTHCRQIDHIILSKIKRSESEEFQETKSLFITRKGEWVVWHAETDRTRSDKEYRVISRKAEFIKTGDISEFLQKSGAGPSIIDVLFLWLENDIPEEETKLKKKIEMRHHVRDIYERAKKVVRLTRL